MTWLIRNMMVGLVKGIKNQKKYESLKTLIEKNYRDGGLRPEEMKEVQRVLNNKIADLKKKGITIKK